MKPVLIALVAVLLVFQYKLWFANGGLMSAWWLKHSITVQAQKNKQLQKRNTLLSADIKDLKSGKKAVEERARNNLGMIKKGETFYQVVKPE